MQSHVFFLRRSLCERMQSPSMHGSPCQCHKRPYKQRQCGDGFKNRRTNFPGRAWTARGVVNLAKSGHNRGSTKLSTPSPPLARRRPRRGFLMGTLGRVQAKKCHTYPVHHSSRADILKDGDVERRRQRTSPGEVSGVESGATGNIWEDVPVTR